MTTILERVVVSSHDPFSSNLLLRSQDNIVSLDGEVSRFIPDHRTGIYCGQMYCLDLLNAELQFKVAFYYQNFIFTNKNSKAKKNIFFFKADFQNLSCENKI